MNLPKMDEGEGDLRRSYLESKWQEEHQTVRHEAQTPLRLKKTKDTKNCFKLGVCLCDRLDVKLFVKKLSAHLKTFFKIVKRVATMERSLYEGGFIVLRFLCPLDDGRELFLHVGYSHFVTWEFTCCRLHRVQDRHQAIDRGTVLLCLGQSDDFADCTNDFCSVFSAVKSWMDLSLPWSLQHWEIYAEEQPVELRFMESRYVEVIRLKPAGQPHDSETVVLWKGWEVEKPRRKKRGPRGPRGSAAKKSRSRNPFHPLADDDDDDDDEMELGDAEGSEVAVDAIHDWFDSVLDFDAQEAGDQDVSHDENDEVQHDAEDALVHLLDSDAGNIGDGNTQHNDHAEKDGDDELVLPEPRNLVRHLFEDESDEHEEVLHPFPPRQQQRPRAPDAAPRQPKQPEEVFPVPGFGDIRFSTRGSFFRAHCSLHGPTCRRQRQSTAGRHMSMGRPIGSLISWLQSSSEHITDVDHKTAATASFEDRRKAREWFESLPGGKDFADRHERELIGSEPREPRYQWN